MNGPPPINSALVPRQPRPASPAREGQPFEPEIDPAPAYAPPGSELRARVRHLDGDAVDPVDPERESPHAGTLRLQQAGEQEQGQGLVLKIEAELRVIGTLPAEGVAVETVALLKPAKAQESGRWDSKQPDGRE